MSTRASQDVQHTSLNAICPNRFTVLVKNQFASLSIFQPAIICWQKHARFDFDPVIHLPSHPQRLALRESAGSLQAGCLGWIPDALPCRTGAGKHPALA